MSSGPVCSSAQRWAMADLRLAAWFLWMTPLLAALSRFRQAVRMAAVASSRSPVSAASRNLRTEVFSEVLTALLRCRGFSFCLLRLIWDLMFATRKPHSGFVWVPETTVAPGRAAADSMIQRQQGQRRQRLRSDEAG